MKINFAILLAALAVALSSMSRAAESSTQYRLDIAPQRLGAALMAFGEQSGVQILMKIQNEAIENAATPRLSGDFTARGALDRLLENTGLNYEFVDKRTVRITAVSAGERAQMHRAANSQMRLADASAASQGVAVARRKDKNLKQTDEEPAGPAADSSSAGIPEILVKGSRSSNTDIRRTEDDVQPYVVFDAEEIGRSMAPDLETFLRTRLPMNQSRSSNGQSVTLVLGNQSSIDLRGLGADQTLILVNGRRMPGVATSVDFYQPDINGIPISSVERIEVLPSTAGGIYGGGATGGVVNIILKRDYNDLEVTARYDGTLAGGGAQRRLDATAGFSLEGGRTNIMLTASYRDGNPLYIGDRNFTARARALQDENNHVAFRTSSTPVHGYTTNIRSANGSNLVLKDGMRSLNSPIASVPVGYAGPASDNGAAFLGTADRYSLALADDVVGNQYSLLNAPSVRSLQLSVRREFTDRIEVFADAARYDNRSVRMGSSGVQSLVNVILPAGPNNPFTQAVRLSVPLVGYEGDRMRTPSASLSEQLSVGVIVRLPREWMVQGEYSLGRSHFTYKFPGTLLTADGSAALIDGRLNLLRDVNAYPLDFSAFYPGETGRRTTGEFLGEPKSATLRVSGPLLQLPGGPVRLAALLERREQFTGDRVVASYPLGGGTPTSVYYPEIGSSTDSGYAELNAPLVSAANARPGLLGLDLRASYRYDTTKTRTRPLGAGSSFVIVPSPDGPFPQVPFQTNSVTGNQYTLGFRYTPLENVTLRISYGEGILPPVPSQLAEADLSSLAELFLSDYLDPKRGGLPVDATTVELYSFMGNLLLRPEHSASWSGGLIFTPAILPGFRLSVDYTRIEKTDEIGYLSEQRLLDLEDDFPGAVVRNELTAADAALGYTGGTIRVFRSGNVNIARSLMEALDIQADYSWETRLGSFAASVMATVQPRLSQQAVPDSADLNTVGYSDGPLKWRANAGLRWSRGAWDLGWNLQYYDASRVYTSTTSTIGRNSALLNAVLNQGSELIPTQTYHDVYGRYRFENAPGFAGGLLENTELQISVQNVFNTSPPILASASPFTFGGYATEGDARLRRYSVAFTKRFGQ